MKLLSCHVEGYGKIKNQSFPFREGLTSFFWKNGEGKSTLASFLKAMLYGLENKTGKSFREREHFYPFDGSRCGGNLCLEANGKQYRIERFFDEKSETKDSLTVYEDGTPLKNPPTDLGKLLLELDKESFERTLFLRHEDLEIAFTTGIHDRLNQFLEGCEEEGGLDGALEAIDKAEKVYKRRGGNDKISEEKARIQKLDSQIQNAEFIKAALEGKYAKEQILRAELEGLQAEQTKAQKQREIASQFEHYESLVENVRQAEEASSKIAEKYPLGVPSLEETNTFNAHLGAFKEAQMRMENAKLAETDERAFASITARFGGNIPGEEVFRETEKKIGRLSTLRAEMAAQRRAPTERERLLEEKFLRGKPSSKELETIESRLAAYREKKQTLVNTPKLTQGGVPAAISTKKYGFLAVIAALCAALGVGLLMTSLIFVGAALVVVGGLGLFAVGFLYLNKKSSVPNLSVENPLYTVLERETALLEQTVRDLLFPYGYGGEGNVEIAVERLQTELTDYDEMQSVKLIAQESFAKNAEEAKRLEEDLTAFFERYGENEGDFIERLTSLRRSVGNLQSLSARKEKCEEICQKALAEQADLREKMTAYQEKYGLLVVDCAEILGDIKELERLSTVVHEGKEKATAYRREKGLGERAEATETDFESLTAQVNERRERLAQLVQEIVEDERVAETLEGYEAEKREAESRKKEYERRQKLLSATSGFLKLAAGNLRKKYVAPVLNEFVANAALLEQALGAKVEMTKDFKLLFEHNGVNRSEKHLSSGQRSICALCFRLALIKNMYREQAPFLVLDDPFVTLDEEHLARVRDVLQTLSKDMQLLYFTCHSSRQI